MVLQALVWLLRAGAQGGCAARADILAAWRLGVMPFTPPSAVPAATFPSKLSLDEGKDTPSTSSGRAAVGPLDFPAALKSATWLVWLCARSVAMGEFLQVGAGVSLGQE